MARSFFKNQLASKTVPNAKEKKAGAATAENPAKENTAEAPAETPEPICVFDDVEVCRLLGVRRKELVDARKASTRGKDWDCCGLHAGMSKAWIDAYALSHGIVPDFSVPLTPIKPNDGIVTVEMIGATPNPNLCMVEIIATKERRYATVRNQYQRENQHYLHEQFNCLNIEGRLEWCATFNQVKRY